MAFKFTYTGIQVRDLDRSIAFYRDLLGMEFKGRSKVPETAGETAGFTSPGSNQVLELNWYPEGSRHFKGPYRHGDELDHLAFQCDDADRAYADLVRKGAQTGIHPFTEGGGRIAYVRDPDGIWIELFSAPVENAGA